MTRPARDARLLSGAYVLDALTPQEAAAMDAAMRTDEDLRGEVAELTDTAVLLGLATTAVEPPPALRARLFEAIDRTPQLPALDPVEAEAEPESSDVPESSAVPESSDVRESSDVVAVAVVRPGPAHWFQRPVALLAAAAAAVALLFGGGLALQQTLAPNVSQEASAFSALTQSPDVRRAQQPVRGGGTAVVYWSPKLRSSAVVLSGATAPSGRVLQLWHIRGTSITSAGLYRPQHGEHFQMLQGVPTSEQKVAVSVEPEGGSKAPTTRPIATVTIA